MLDEMLLVVTALHVALHFGPILGQDEGCEPVVVTEHGLVRGKQMNTSAGNAYFAYRGIPYVGDPFRTIIRLVTLSLLSDGCQDGSYSFDDSKPTCQPIPPNATFLDGRNSLTINIYVPKQSQSPCCGNHSKTRPVIFYNNGGGAESVQSYMDNGKYIVVLLSYQLGQEGYIRCNNQTQAVDLAFIYGWLIGNIAYFGGDAVRIEAQPSIITSPIPDFPEMSQRQAVIEEEPPSEIRKGPIFTLRQGQIQGTIMSTATGKTFTAFFAIPYAMPPVGRLRFRAPLPGRNWTGVFDATKQGPICLHQVIQFALPPITISGEEDCLILNVYVPTSANGNLVSKNLPVYVWIYGGGFNIGGENFETTGPQRFLDTANMIIVIPNYRMGALGFLSTEDRAASGNWGLLDQNLALRWVRDNIRLLGGDPGNVTIGGGSAGSASVSYHMLSPLSAGLFHRAIAQSSSALCPYALSLDPLSSARRLARKFLCDRRNTEELVDCLRRQDGRAITLRSIFTVLQFFTSNFPFVPVVENSSTGVFLKENPLTLFEEGRFTKVPVIMGFNRDDGNAIYYGLRLLFQSINPLFFAIVIPFLLREETHYTTNLQEVSRAIENQYYAIDRSNQTAVARASLALLGDMVLISWIVQTVDFMAAHDTPVYMYAFNYVGDKSISNFSGENDVSHSNEVAYLFNVTSSGPLTPRDEAFSKRLLQLWSNFILTGNPTPSGTLRWSPTPPNVHRHLDINTQFSMVDGYEEGRMRFWNVTVPRIVAG